MFDREVHERHIQALSSADAVAGFFSRLQYNTNARIQQNPENLGITAESTKKPIRRIERIADQEGLFQVYLLELQSVTVVTTKALARAFRNLQGNYLLVLTNDYEKIDFVLLDKETPQDQSGSPIGLRQVRVRPRTLTIERRRPTLVQRRVLSRLTYTESDPFAQYEKLRFAYDVADWSEEHFNNRALFSDYYLKERLPGLKEWKENTKPCYQALADLYRSASSNFTRQKEEVICSRLIEPTFRALGFTCKRGKAPGSAAAEPDYLLSSSRGSGPPIAFALVYPWARSLDGKDEERDSETAQENPGAVVVSRFEEGDLPWAIVTNGKLWRLYSRQAHSRATNYYEIDLEEVMSQKDPNEAFRYFWLLFRCQAFERVEMSREGERTELSFLDRLLLESGDYGRELGERLKEKVFTGVFKHLAEGFLSFRRSQRSDEPVTQEELDEIYRGTLTLLYRLLFLLYAESRDLLPSREIRGYWECSLNRLKQEIAGQAGTISDETESKIRKAYDDQESFELYERLQQLFQVVEEGSAKLNVPAYNGGLFLSTPADDHFSAESESARFLAENCICDPFLARAIDLLARDHDPKRQDLVFVDYKSLGVRQLGSIYEGLLEFRLRVAEERLGVTTEKKREVYTPYKKLSGAKQEQAVRKGQVIEEGELYLENDRRERKATGSYYTPDHIVRYIIEHTVGPVLDQKFKTLRPKFREAQQWNRERVRLALQKREITSKYESGPVVENRWGGLVEAIFDIKVLDPAMGSGHFLVEAVDYITDQILDFLNGFPWNPVLARLTEMRRSILREMEEREITIDEKKLTDVNLLKRHVLKRCVYGVDFNPMAVELAKVSLWLDCFTLGAPLSFLDHHLRWGNSLIGVGIDEAREALEWRQSLFASRFTGLMLATDMMRRVGELSDLTSSQVNESRSQYRRASDTLWPFKRLLDIYTGQWFLQGVSNAQKAVVEFLQSSEAEELFQASSPQAFEEAVDHLQEKDRIRVRKTLQDAAAKRFFHWDLEFPEVFFEKGQQSHQRREDGGFDAVVGNPPYVRQEGLSRDKDYFKVAHEPVYSGVADLYVYFYHQGLRLCRPGGRFGMITSNKFTRARYGEKLRQFLKRLRICQLIDFGDLPIFDEASAYPLVAIVENCSSSGETDFQALTVKSMKQALEIERSMEEDSFPMNVNFLRKEGFAFQSPEVHRLLEKIRSRGRPLKEVIGNKFYYGIKTGYNQAFVIDEARRQELIAADPKSDEIIKPFLRGRDIKRWRVEWAGLYLIKTEIDVDIERYPAVFEHLSQYQEKLEKRWDKGKHWWELRACDYYQEFEKPKIVYPDIHESLSFAVDSEGFYLTNTAYFFPSSHKYLLALLNSRLLEFYYRNISVQIRGGYLRAFTFYIEELPICDVAQEDKNLLFSLGERIERTKVSNEVVMELEKEINQAVYRLYGLEAQEIEVLERANA